MAIGPDARTASELDVIRSDYESSLSWRVTRPLRALGRGADVLGLRRRTGREPSPPPPVLANGRYDTWLRAIAGRELDRLDARCADGGADRLALFRELDDDVWALLLTQEYEDWPNLRALLPAMPHPALQELWNGASGARLAVESTAFYRRLRERVDATSERPLAEARVLDFGCGWGRLTRYLARDVTPGRLYGCDPVASILDACRDAGVPAELAQSAFVPDRLPFDERFDVAFAFSVFTHLSETAHERCLAALNAGLAPGGILVVTIRPPEYLRFCADLHPLLAALGPDPAARLEEPRYLFAPHAAEPSHPQYAGGAMTYGETVITLAYVRERWAPGFELLHADLLLGDLFQVVLTLRRTDAPAD